MKKIDRFRPRPQYTRIEGLSSILRLPRLGKIRLGIKVKKKNADSRCKHPKEELCLYCSYPRDTDYFVVPPEVAEKYGQQPKELDVLVPCEDQALWFPQALKCYRGSRLWCKGDGRTATRINMDTGEMLERECPCEHYRGNEKPADPVCTERANLMVLLPRVSMGGCFQLDSGSYHNIVEINSTVEWLRGMIGRVAFVPLKLKRVPTQMQVTEAGGKVRTATKALLKLEFEGDFAKVAALRGADIIAIEGGSQSPRALMPPTPVEDGDDFAPGGVVVEEEPFEKEDAASDHPSADADPEGSEGETSDPPPQTEEQDDAAAVGGPEEPKLTNVDVICAFIAGASSAKEAMDRYKERAKENPDLSNDQKMTCQDALNKRLKELKAGRR